MEVRTQLKKAFATFTMGMLMATGLFSQKPAEVIPSFSFVKLNKSTFTDKQVSAGKMVFFIFFDSDCEHCQRAMQYFNTHYKELEKTEIYLVTLDDKEKIFPFLAQYAPNLKDKKNITLLRDTNNQFVKIFGPGKYPSVFLYGKDRKLVLYEDNEDTMFRFLKYVKDAKL